jgi:hypothetical protein
MHAHLDGPCDHFFFCQILVPITTVLGHLDVTAAAFGGEGECLL